MPREEFQHKGDILGDCFVEREFDRLSTHRRMNSPTTDNTDMKAHYQSWAVHNYGDSGKTKTVTRKKYGRISGFLRGEVAPAGESTKFRFWVKAKGFKLGPPAKRQKGVPKEVLYVPVKTTVSVT